jgi:S-methylmethionine-dependent homocysteine/selenocysteine methylase
LADGQPLREAIEAADAFTGAQAAWFTVHCADPAHLLAALDGDGSWARRVRGIRARPAFPDAAGSEAIRRTYTRLAERAPWLTIADLSGGRNLRHAAAMAWALREGAAVPA